MRRTFLISIVAVASSLLLSVAAADELSGEWSGPWYRGMTSGIMTLEIDGEGKGLVQFTNLDNFGEDTVAVSKLEKDSKGLKFSAAGAGAAVFSASARLTGDGKLLKGEGEYEGFAIEFRLKRR
jgi:hypothetical protein